MDKLIELFLQDCVTRGLGSSTLDNYTLDCAVLDHFLTNNYKKYWLEIPCKELVNQLSILDNTLAQSRRKRLRAACREFYRYLNRNAIYVNGYMDLIPNEQLNLKKQDIVPFKKVTSLIGRADNLRDKCILLLLIEHTLLPSEVSSIKHKDLDISTGVIHLNSGRTIIANAKVANYLKLHLINSTSLEEGYLFLSRTGKKLETRSIDNMIAKYSPDLGITCTIIRNTVALHYFEKNNDFMELHRLLGHKHMRSTGYFLDRFYSESASFIGAEKERRATRYASKKYIVESIE